ncbi:Cof-type HAD-IIB family hydrolase [Paenibacillus chungangensis]|uniref:Cof-type HAD-IIB family hydrolase n=1 Tax=Paenibacillus chungangensis TaxID=696535 RepID=A0ABW3HQL5_9BACL
MKCKIVFFDIDGTLVNEQKDIPQDTVEAIRELKASGVEPVVATGRAPYFIGPILEKLGIESYVCLNGGYVVYKGEPIYRFAIARDIMGKLVDKAEEHGHGLVYEGAEAYYANQETNTFMTDSVLSLKVNPPGYDPEFWQKEDVYQTFLHCEAQEETLYESLKDELTFIRWHECAMDVLPKGGSKAKGIEAMLNKLGYDASQAVAFGDGLNDKEMLEYVGFGIAMGNSHPDLLPYADYVTAHVDDSGIRRGLVKAELLPAKAVAAAHRGAGAV